MDTLKINATENTPRVICTAEGTISIIGKSISEDPIAFYKPIHDWISNLKAENIEISIQLEYLNTSSSKQIYNLLTLAKDNIWKKTFLVKWYYDINDEDEFELGKEYESLLEVPFEFYNYYIV
jgi:hypothetical protein